MTHDLRRSAPNEPPANPSPQRTTTDTTVPFDGPVAAFGPEALLRLSALAGNQAVGALIAPPPPPRPTSGPMVQRQGAAPAADPAVLSETLNIVNKGSTFKLKINAAPQIRGGVLEIKKVALEIDGSNEVSAPGLTSASAPVKAAGGSANTATTKTNAKPGEETSAARVLAADLSGRLPGIAQTKLKDVIKWKVSGEATPGVERKAAASVTFDTEVFSGEVSINFLHIDLKAKDPKDRFKPMTATIKLGIGKFGENTFPKAMHFAGQDLDLKVRFKVSGAIDVGPRWELMEKEILRKFGKDALQSYQKSLAETIAREEMFLAVDDMADRLAREATSGITDAELKAAAFEQAKQRVLMEAKEQGVDSRLINVMMKEGAGHVDLASARHAMRVAAEQGVKETFEIVGRSVVREAIKDILKTMSAKRIGQAVWQALKLGPVDVVLAGIDLLAGYLISISRSQQIKEMGMTAQLVRDNYVKGYAEGVAGRATGQGDVGGGGSPEGAGYIAGTKDGAAQFNQTVDIKLQTDPDFLAGNITREAVIEGVKQFAATQPVDKTKVIAAASPKLEKMLIDAYIEANTGLLDKLFGEDVRSSSSFKRFEDMVKSNLDPSAKHTEVAHLANGVNLTLTALDYTKEAARRFRTPDGAHIVYMGGDTTKYSGWITENDRRPLEELYPNANAADAAEKGAGRQQENMRAIMDRLRASAAIEVRGTAVHITGLTLIGPGAEDDQFAQYVRTAEALSRPLGSFSKVHVRAVYYPAGVSQGGILFIERGNGPVSAQDTGNADLLRMLARNMGIDTESGNIPHAVGQRLYGHLEGKLLANFPLPTLRG